MTATPLAALETSEAPAAGEVPAHLAAVAHRTDLALGRLIAEERRRWAAVDPGLDRPLEALADAALGGGKRLRPAFCHWGVAAAGGDPGADPDAGRLDAAMAALELLHAFALVHDDVMDEAPSRRGRPTQHVRFATQHRAHRWRGTAERFGESVAILVGDLAHVLADDLVSELPAPARAVWRELQTELVLGQFLDVELSASNRVTVDRALRIARLKSGRYTIRRPLELGVALARHTPPDREPGLSDRHAGLSDRDAGLSAYGEALGLAFQLRDDLLGAFGDPAVTGKPVGADLREGKPTPLLALGLERATAAQRAVLATAGDPALDDEGVAAIQEVLLETGAAQQVERLIDDLTAEAVDRLRQPTIPTEARVALIELADFVARREH